MPKKKHRMSWMYEGSTMEDAVGNPEEDTLAASPVEVAYQSYEATPARECPDNDEVPLAEESPPPDEYAREEVCLSEDGGPPVEEYAREEVCLSEDGGPPVEEYALEKVCSSVDEALPAEEYPMLEDDTVAQDRTFDDGAALAEPHTPAEPEPAIPHDSEVDDAASQAVGDTKMVQDQAKEVVIICTSCTIMLFTDYNGPCPFHIISTLGPEHESYSWLLHTTCSSCISKHKTARTSREQFGNGCMAAFEAALFSEEFMKRTRWFEAAERICRTPLRVLMSQGRRSAAYVKIDDFRQESTNECRMRVLKPLGSESVKSGSVDILESFMPGGFL